MTRAIDCEIAKKRLQAWIDESEAQGFEEAARNFRDCISLLDAVPTLTPPNEPLTLDELREMDGEPVWFENMSGGRWCIVCADYRCLIGKFFGVTFEEIERTGRVYRRPPEGDV